jgi:hypothetical protein
MLLDCRSRMTCGPGKSQEGALTLPGPQGQQKRQVKMGGGRSEEGFLILDRPYPVYSGTVLDAAATPD